MSYARFLQGYAQDLTGLWVKNDTKEENVEFI